MNCVHSLIRTKQVRVEDDVDSPQAELVAEVTNILDTLQVNFKTYSGLFWSIHTTKLCQLDTTCYTIPEAYVLNINTFTLGSEQSFEEGRVCSKETDCQQVQVGAQYFCQDKLH